MRESVRESVRKREREQDGALPYDRVLRTADFKQMF